MEITTFEIDKIKRYLRQHWVTNEVFITKTSNQFVDEIREIDAKNITFDNALEQTFHKFGGTEKIIALEQSFLNNEFKIGIKDYFGALKTYFTERNKIIFVLLLVISLYFLLSNVNNLFYVSTFFIGLIVFQLGSVVYFAIKNKDNQPQLKLNGVSLVNTILMSMYMQYKAYYIIHFQNPSFGYILMSVFLNTLFLLNIWIVFSLMRDYHYKNTENFGIKNLV